MSIPIPEWEKGVWSSGQPQGLPLHHGALKGYYSSNKMNGVRYFLECDAPAFDD